MRFGFDRVCVSIVILRSPGLIEVFFKFFSSSTPRPTIEAVSWWISDPSIRSYTHLIYFPSVKPSDLR